MISICCQHSEEWYFWKPKSDSIFLTYLWSLPIPQIPLQGRVPAFALAGPSAAPGCRCKPRTTLWVIKFWYELAKRKVINVEWTFSRTQSRRGDCVCQSSIRIVQLSSGTSYRHLNCRNPKQMFRVADQPIQHTSIDASNLYDHNLTGRLSCLWYNFCAVCKVTFQV